MEIQSIKLKDLPGEYYATYNFSTEGKFRVTRKSTTNRVIGYWEDDTRTEHDPVTNVTLLNFYKPMWIQVGDRFMVDRVATLTSRYIGWDYKKEYRVENITFTAKGSCIIMFFDWNTGERRNREIPARELMKIAKLI